MFKKLLLEDQDGFTLESDSQDIQVDISDFGYQNLNVQQSGFKEVGREFLKKALDKLNALEKELVTSFKQDIEVLKKFQKDKNNQKKWEEIKAQAQELKKEIDRKSGEIKAVIDSKGKEIKSQIDQKKLYIKNEIETAKKEWKERNKFEAIVPWLIPVGGATLMTSDINAKSIDPSKCPTMKQVRKVAKEIDQAKKEFYELENTTKSDFDSVAKKMKPLLEIKEQYKSCQRLSYYK